MKIWAAKNRNVAVSTQSLWNLARAQKSLKKNAKTVLGMLSTDTKATHQSLDLQATVQTPILYPTETDF
ncbi:Hypothetical predicted protein [Cloeon dipterum]|uniref:Uncharacterized protein n=1 Tax=Cloeon dipterum TaxID=197152 RepID=A0A8S1CC23_9INSE|nr:Hypothetical predicted protein [Cloeon dipterum]